MLSGYAPFLSWVGGKRKLVPSITKLIPSNFNKYHEPFLGGGAVFFSMQKYLDKSNLSDANDLLISTYLAVQQDINGVIVKLKEHAKNHSLEYYKKIRGLFQQYPDKVNLAAAFIYLNKTCFSGIYRVNSSGKFNVPMNLRKTRYICQEEKLRNASRALRAVTLSAGSFEEAKPDFNDLVYCDPPYDGTFTAYTSAGFGEDKQKALKRRADIWRESGVHVIVSNSDTAFIRGLWHDWCIESVSTLSTINRIHGARTNAKEVLMHV